MVEVSAGEYLPLTPSFFPRSPLFPAYLGRSYLPPSIVKWRWPWPSRGAGPTALGAISKSLRATVTFPFGPVFAPAAGVRKRASPFDGSAFGASLDSEEPAPEPLSD